MTNRNNWTPPPESNITAFAPVEPIGKHVRLYNISADPYEWYDVSDENPSVVKKLLDRLVEYHKTMVPPICGQILIRIVIRLNTVEYGDLGNNN